MSNPSRQQPFRSNSANAVAFSDDDSSIGPFNLMPMETESLSSATSSTYEHRLLNAGTTPFIQDKMSGRHAPKAVTEMAVVENPEAVMEVQEPLSDIAPIATTSRFPTPRFSKQSEWASDGTTDVQIFYPTLEEMRNFTAYMEKLEREIGPQLVCGICKIVPPAEWSSTLSRTYNYDAIDSLTIFDSVQETGIKEDGAPHGVYRKINKIFKTKRLSARMFRELATSKKYEAPKKIASLKELEKYYWKNTFKNEPIYGADTPGTLFDREVDVFNINKLGTLLDLLNETNITIEGVNTPYLYFGMYKTTFAWHAEDMDLYSINYLHLGEPKFWYAIPPEAADRFERLAAQFFPGQSCKAFLRHKMFQIAPSILRHHGIPFGTMVQYPGEFIITFPRGYHMGFNTGFNIAEATNFALDRWIDYGKNVTMCKCSKETVEIAMAPFMERYRPQELPVWYHYWYHHREQFPKELRKKGIKWVDITKYYSDLPREQQLVVVVSGRQHQSAVTKMKMLAHVFGTKPQFHYDKRYNKAQGKIFPNCAICQYFVPDLNLYTDFSADFPMPKQTRRYVNNKMLIKNSVCKTADPTEDDLLTCDNCGVVVHRHCYAVIPYDDGIASGKFHDLSLNDTFLCYRCRNRDKDLIEHTICHFCPMRGGAFMPAICGLSNKHLFAHVICAIAHRMSKVVSISGKMTPFCYTMASGKLFAKNSNQRLIDKLNPFKIKFEDAYLKADMNIMKIPRSVQCDLCCDIGENLILCGLCDENKPRYLHATCARLMEIIYEARLYPTIILPICSAHIVELPGLINETEVDTGDIVRISDKHKNVRIGLINGITLSETNHTIDYFDGSRSCDISSEDIRRCECNELLCDRVNHIYGSMVYINWDNGTVYEGYYRGCRQEHIAKITFNHPLPHSPNKIFRSAINVHPIQYDITKYEEIVVPLRFIARNKSSASPDIPAPSTSVSNQRRSRKRPAES